MKVTNLLSSIHTLTSIALASPVKRAESLHLRNFYVQHADNGTGALQFALHSTVTGLSDECTLSWYVVHSIVLIQSHCFSSSPTATTRFPVSHFHKMKSILIVFQ